MRNDEMLRQAAAISAERFLASAARGYDPANAWTPPPRFVRKITRLTRRADHPHVYRVLRRAASLILAALLTGAAWLAVDPEARAAFTAWVREVYENSVIYEFIGPRDPAPLPEYVLTALPEGFVETKSIVEQSSCNYVYENDSEIVIFSYMVMSDKRTKQLIGEIRYHETVQVNGYPGDFYAAAAADDTNELIWMDEKNRVMFQISAFREMDEMLALAESVVKK